MSEFNVLPYAYTQWEEENARQMPFGFGGFNPGFNPGFHPGFNPGFNPGFHPGFRPFFPFFFPFFSPFFFHPGFQHW